MAVDSMEAPRSIQGYLGWREDWAALAQARGLHQESHQAFQGLDHLAGWAEGALVRVPGQAFHLHLQPGMEVFRNCSLVAGCVRERMGLWCTSLARQAPPPAAN